MARGDPRRPTGSISGTIVTGHTANQDKEQAISRLVVRTYQPDDQPAVTRLYTHGLLEGQIAPNDSGADIENILAAYFAEQRNHFWVAQLDDNILGMIGVAREEAETDEIRRLRVDKDWQQTSIGRSLSANHRR